MKVVQVYDSGVVAYRDEVGLAAAIYRAKIDTMKASFDSEMSINAGVVRHVLSKAILFTLELLVIVTLL